MEISNEREAKTRMIHVRLPEDVHKKLRIGATETDVTVQDRVLKVIQRELARQDRQAKVTPAAWRGFRAWNTCKGA